jgi:ABC-type multidrug transport system ATPase subunit
MKITLSNTGKKFNRDWIFRNINLEFQLGAQVAILGPNGSGKSTLLQVIAGSITVSEGTIKYETSDISRQTSVISDEEVYSHIAICAPYLQLIEELTLTELLAFHIRFKPLLNNMDVPTAIGLIGLPDAAHKQLRHFSSGMKQRVKLGLAILSNSSLLILDEPLTNLDDKARQWYYDLIEVFIADTRTVLVGSNRPDEYAFCKQQVNILDYKK